MYRYSYDVSTLFGSLNSNNSNNLFSSFNYSDYSAIKNGSYGKLLKSYYNDQKTSTTSEKSTSTTKKEQTVDKTGLSKMKMEAEELSSAAKALSEEDFWKQTAGKVDVDKIVSKVKGFADEYNGVLTQASKVSSSEVSNSMQYMKSMTSTMSKALSNIGITVGDDGKMTVNEETLKNADIKSVKSLFYGAGTYGAQISSRADEISKATIMNSSLYTSTGSVTSTLVGMFDSWA